MDGEIIWAPAIAGAFVLTTRGGDFGLYIGQDVSIGYLSHTDAAVRLYLQETFTFLLLTTEAVRRAWLPPRARARNPGANVWLLLTSPGPRLGGDGGRVDADQFAEAVEAIALELRRRAPP